MGIFRGVKEELDEAERAEEYLRSLADEFTRSPEITDGATKADLFQHAVRHLAIVYEFRTGRWAGSSASHNTTTKDRGGPFVRFVASVLEVMEPDSRRKGLGASIAKILPLLDEPLMLHRPWKSPREWEGCMHRGFYMVR